MKSTFARRMSILLVLAMVLAMLPVGAMAADSTTLYLSPNANWNMDGARFAAYFFQTGLTETWASMTDADGDGVYEVTVPEGYTNVIFCRMNPGTTENNWSNKWNQTSDLVVPTDGTNLYTVAEGAWDKGAGVWTTYTPGDEVTEATVTYAYDYYVVGSMNDWTLADDAMGMTDTDGDGIYTVVVAMEAGSYTYLINVGDYSQKWDDNGSDFSLSLASACDVTFALNPTTGEVTATGDGLGEAPVVENPIPEGTAVNVKGTLPGLDWDNTAATGAMTLVDGVYTLTIADVPASEVGAAAYEFKVMLDNSWDTAYPESNWTFYLSAACDVTITIDATTREVGLSAEYLTYDAPTEGGETTENTYGVVGGLVAEGEAGWAAETAVAMTKNDDGTYSAVFSAVAAGDYEIKVIENGSWDVSYGDNGNNYAFTVSAECDVTVTFDPATSTVSVTGDNVGEVAAEELVIESVVVAGGAANEETVLNNFLYGQVWDPTATGMNSMFADEGTKIYTATYMNVEAGTYEFKFALNGGWDISYASGVEIVSGEEATAWFNPLGNSTVVVEKDGSTVTLVLDLTDVVYVGDDAKMTVTVEAPAESSAPESLVIGDNSFVIGQGDNAAVTSTYTAAADGKLLINVTYMKTADGEVPVEYIANQFGWFYQVLVNGVQVYLPGEVEVAAGDVVTVGVLSTMGNSAEITVTLCTGHNFVDGTCSVCGMTCVAHNWDAGVCLTCGKTCAHETWDGAWCTGCWMQCEHSWTYTYSATTHTFVCSGICSQTITADNTDSKQFKINSAAPVLSDDIVLKYRVTVPAGFENPYMVFELNGETTYVYEYTTESDGKLCFAFPGLNPQKMADSINATLYASIGNTEVCVKNENFSIVKYCNIQMQYYSSNTTLMTILSDLLVYGEKTQIYQGYKTDALITDQCTGTLTPSTFTTLGSEYNLMAATGDVDANVRYSSVSLILSGKMTLRYVIMTETPENYTYKITLNGETFEYTSEDLIADETTAGKYYLDFNKMKATQFGLPITATIEQDGVQTSKAIQFSVYTYIYMNQNTSDVALSDLLKAIYNYGESAKKA